MVHAYSIINSETMVKAGPFPLDNLSEPEIKDSRSEIKYPLKEGKEYNDISDKISGENMSTGFLEDKLSSDNIEAILSQDYQELTDLIYIDELIYEQEYKRNIDIIRLLIKQETIDILDILTENNNINKLNNIICKSTNYLHTFAELISEDLICLENNKIVMTTLCHKMANAIAEGIYD